MIRVYRVEYFDRATVESLAEARGGEAALSSPLDWVDPETEALQNTIAAATFSHGLSVARSVLRQGRDYFGAPRVYAAEYGPCPFTGRKEWADVAMWEVEDLSEQLIEDEPTVTYEREAL